MQLERLALLAGAAVVAGAVNAVAGGGSLVSFPALLAAGVSPVAASATNTVALAPGSLAAAFAYRRELSDNRRSAVLLMLAAGVGSLIGATLLLKVPERIFELVVPWLILAATGVLLAKDRVARWAKAGGEQPTRGRLGWVALLLAVVSVYGGYFGAGMGIVTLALLALLRRMTIHEMNAVKTLIVGGINGIAAVYFLWSSAAELPAAAAMASGALAGGYGAARFVRRVPPEPVRRGVVALGVVLSLVLAYRYWL